MEGIQIMFVLTVSLIAAEIVFMLTFPVINITFHLLFQNAIFHWSTNLRRLVSLMTALGVAGSVIFIITAPYNESSYRPWFKPDQKEFVGVWYPTDTTLDTMGKSNYPITTQRLTILKNGSFSMTNLPDVVFGNISHIYCSGSGVWKLEKNNNDQWTLFLHFTRINKACKMDRKVDDPTMDIPVSLQPDEFTYNLSFWNNKPPYLLMNIFYFDRGIVFYRSNPGVSD